ncbi:Transducin/WD40 repeat-like superfamily protein [Hibiscus syriacus]|uniref:Transducin/WD40 repeat-like superfamily protein n=1 Tax=Hibiscus syriacus TaxID=106335 RepID=A0A6A2XMV1_HIBSY|nr:Transducin/WD40 repeat-like superfamily protein [Hibiscus syriacus]
MFLAQAMLKVQGRQPEGGDYSRYVRRKGSENSTGFTITRHDPSTYPSTVNLLYTCTMRSSCSTYCNRVLEDACKDDEELRAVLGDSIGDPEQMRKRVEERVRKKGRDFNKKKTGSVPSFKVSFRDCNPLDSYIWFELYGSPSDREVNLIGSVTVSLSFLFLLLTQSPPPFPIKGSFPLTRKSHDQIILSYPLLISAFFTAFLCLLLAGWLFGAIQSWYVMGRLGAFNSSNLQLATASMEYDPLYDADKGFNVMPSSFHDISDVEFQENWGRVWVDLGTSDFSPIDVLLNCMTVLSADYLGIQQTVFCGHRIGDWEECLTNRGVAEGAQGARPCMAPKK